MDNIYLPLSNIRMKKNNFYLQSGNSPFFSILNEEYVSRSFIEFIKTNSIVEAKTLFSRFVKENIDTDILKEFFNDEYIYKTVNRVPFNKSTKKKINSFLIMDKKQKPKNIINFYMVNEPDRFSQWKIYKITKETIL